jgi:hypothetical protein
VLAWQRPEAHRPGAVELLDEARLQAVVAEQPLGGLGVGVAGGAVVGEVDPEARALRGGPAIQIPAIDRARSARSWARDRIARSSSVVTWRSRTTTRPFTRTVCTSAPRAE